MCLGVCKNIVWAASKSSGTGWQKFKHACASSIGPSGSNIWFARRARIRCRCSNVDSSSRSAPWSGFSAHNRWDCCCFEISTAQAVSWQVWQPVGGRIGATRRWRSWVAIRPVRPISQRCYRQRRDVKAPIVEQLETHWGSIETGAKIRPSVGFGNLVRWGVCHRHQRVADTKPIAVADAGPWFSQSSRHRSKLPAVGSIFW